MERAAVERLERLIDREVKARFLAGGVRRVAVLQHSDDPAIEPGELLVRLFVETGGGPEDSQPSLDAWAQAHQAAMKRIRRELSLRLPPGCWSSPSTAPATPVPLPGSRCPTTPS
jgi:hypothetical protein